MTTVSSNIHFHIKMRATAFLSFIGIPQETDLKPKKCLILGNGRRGIKTIIYEYIFFLLKSILLSVKLKTKQLPTQIDRQTDR